MGRLRELLFKESDFVGKDIASLPNRPSAAGMTAQELKERFDMVPKILIALGKMNELITLLDEDGAEVLGLEDALSEVQSALEQILASENERIAKESLRQSEEAVRIAAESIRFDNELERLAQEEMRRSQELVRIDGENRRIARFEEILGELAERAWVSPQEVAELIAQSIAGKVDKVSGRSLVSDELVVKLSALPDADELAEKLENLPSANVLEDLMGSTFDLDNRFAMGGCVLSERKEADGSFATEIRKGGVLVAKLTEGKVGAEYISTLEQYEPDGQTVKKSTTVKESKQNDGSWRTEVTA